MVKNKTILIIEDDLNHSLILRKNMESGGFKVEIAYDGVSGLEAIRKINPDLVILDLLLPKMSGMEVLRKTRHDSKTRLVKVLILTNLIDEQKKKEARDLGVSDYLVKSDYSIKGVTKKVKELI